MRSYGRPRAADRRRARAQGLAVLASLLALVSLLAACGGDDPAPPGDTPVLGDFNTMRKELATIAVTPTQTAVVFTADTVDVAQPTPTPGRPQPTATLTPYVGIFLGETESEDGEPIPTLAPYVINPGGVGNTVVQSGTGSALAAGQVGDCATPVDAVLAAAYSAHTDIQQTLGCPLSGGQTQQLVTQSFERGQMYWRDTRQIYALANSGQFWQVADNWNEGMPADDPAFGSPPGGLMQPVRGFGLVWRTDQALRDALGWGTLPETPFNSTWQDFQGGAMFLGANNQVYAIFPAESRHSGPIG